MNRTRTSTLALAGSAALLLASACSKSPAESNGSTATIQRLMQRAKSGGGFERYNWVKPSSNKSAPKLGYVILMPEWGWMMGTGIYMDDVDQALAKVGAQQFANIRSTMLWIAAIAILGALVVAGCGLGPGETPGSTRLLVTKDFGQKVLIDKQQPEV